MGSILLALAIDFVNIWPSKSPSQTYNGEVFPKRPKAVYPGRVAEQKPLIKEFLSKSEENSCC